MKTITLKDFGLGKYEKGTSPFPLGDLSLQLTGFPNCAGEFRYLAFMNGKKIVQCTVSATDNTVEIEQGLLAAGTLKSRVELYVNGEKVKTLKIEDLTIKDDNNTITADPEIAEIKRRLTAVENTATMLDNQVSVIKNDIVTVEKDCADVDGVLRGMLIAMIKFAYNANNSIPYLNGGDFKTFAKEINLDTSILTDEEINEITGAANDD